MLSSIGVRRAAKFRLMTAAAMSELGFLGAASTTTKIHSVGRPRSDACVKEESGFHYYSSCRQFGLDHVDKEDLSENVKCVEPTDEWRITLVTYNLNKRRAPNFSIDMRTFFSQDEVDKSDIIVIGLQEISHWELFGGEQWRKKFSNILCPRNFTQLSLATTADLKLGTNQLLIFVKQRVLMSIRKTEAHFVRYFHWTDKSLIYSGIAGHKASIGAKISFKNGSYLLLITSHLSARPNAYNKRIREYNSTKWAMPLTKTSSKEHGYTFWLGDLNFRVNDLSAPEVVGCLKNISSDQMHTLLDQHDQLQMAQKVGDAFVDYVEPNVTFPPTYRMIVGSGEYDLLRVPSWCDRILFRVNDSVESLAVKTLSYESLPSVQFSDHVPVKGTFSLRMPTAKDVIGGNKWTIRFDVNTESVSSPYESSVSVRFQAAGSFWKTTGSFFDWIGAYKDDMDDTRQPIAWKYVLSCWDDQIGSETWSYTKFAGLLSGRYRIGYYSRYCDCIIGLSQAFEVRDMTVLAIDRFRFNVKAGAGGNGLARYNGVGGDGGDIYLHARNDVQFKRLLKQLDNADLQRMRGEIGAAATQTKLIGKRGQDTVFKVPTGVEVINADTDTVIVRCNTHDKRYLLAKGGEGGKSTNNFVGQLGEQFNIILSLKLRVDVGLIGFPNAGKSTLLKALTPKKKIHIANYPFTTTKPQVCYLKYDQDVGDDGLFAMSIADLPGLIEGAHLNRGKGHKFLKHVENASIIIFVVDATGFRLSEDSTYRTAAETVGLLNRELELYDSSLLQKPIVLCINKTDLPNSEEKAAAVEEMLREKDWPKLLPEDCRPQNPIVFRSILKTAARDFRLNGLQELLREVYFELNPMASDDYEFFEPRSKKHLT